jgi:hypothetical protein
MVKQLHFERPDNWEEKSRQVASSGLLARLVSPSLESAATFCRGSGTMISTCREPPSKEKKVISLQRLS